MTIVRQALQTLPSGVLAAVATRIGSVAFGFFSTLLLARVLSAAHYGAFAFSVAAGGVLAVGGLLGLDQLSTRELSKALHGREWSRFHAFVKWSGTVCLIASCLLAAFGAVAVWRAPLEPLMKGTLMILVPATPLFAGLRLWRGRLQAIERTATGIFLELPFLNLGLIGVALAMMFGALRSNAQTAALSYVVFAAVALLLEATLFARVQHRNPADSGPSSPQWWRATPFFAGLSLLTILNMSLDLLLVGIMLQPSESGLYSVASRLASLTLIAMIPMQLVIAPRISRLWLQKDSEAASRLAIQVSRTAFFLALPLTILFLAFPRWLLNFFGEPYMAAASLLRIIALSHFLMVIAGPGQSVLAMVGDERTALAVLAAVVAMGIIGSVILISGWGTRGAAVGQLLRLALVSLGMTTMVRWRHGIRVSALSDSMRDTNEKYASSRDDEPRNR